MPTEYKSAAEKTRSVAKTSSLREKMENRCFTPGLSRTGSGETQSVGVNRRQFLKTAATGTAAVSALVSTLPALFDGCAPAQIGKVKSNILLILTDQQHAGTISALGCTDARTPGMDRLVESGIHFSKSYCTYPLCSPARSSIFTGRMPSETGVFQNGRSIRDDMPTMGQWFRDIAGYSTLYAGKWHVPEPHTTRIPGFDVIMSGINGQGQVYDSATAFACDGWIRNRSEQSPFLMVASFLQPHDICQWLRLNQKDPGSLRYKIPEAELPRLPDNFAFDYILPEPLSGIRNRGEGQTGNWSELHWRYYLWSYYRQIEMVDAEIARLLDALEENGQRENTLVVLTSDHGEGLGRHGTVRKSTPWDEAVRVPLIFSQPDTLPGNVRDTDTLVSGLDLFQTFCQIAGVDSPQGVKGEGLKPVLEGLSRPERSFIAVESLNNLGQTIRSDRYKYIAYKDDPVELLFDMETDPGETHNLSGESASAGILEEHRAMLTLWSSGLDVAPDLPDTNRWIL